MTQDFDFFRAGSGDPILFVPGSYSTPAAWRQVQSHLHEGYEIFATSLSGYGQSRERRSQEDISLTPQIDLLSEGMEKNWKTRASGGAFFWRPRVPRLFGNRARDGLERDFL